MFLVLVGLAAQLARKHVYPSIRIVTWAQCRGGLADKLSFATAEFLIWHQCTVRVDGYSLLVNLTARGSKPAAELPSTRILWRKLTVRRD